MVAPWVKRRRARLIKAQEVAKTTPPPVVEKATTPVTEAVETEVETPVVEEPKSAAAKTAAKRKTTARKTRKSTNKGN